MQPFFTEKPPEPPVPQGTAAVEAPQPLEEAMSLAETPEARLPQTTSPVYSVAMGGWNAVANGTTMPKGSSLGRDFSAMRQMSGGPPRALSANDRETRGPIFHFQGERRAKLFPTAPHLL